MIRDYIAKQGVVLGNHQQKVITSFENNRVVAIKNGHSVGVTHVSALILAYYLENEPDTNVWVAAPSYDSIFSVANEVGRYVDKDKLTHLHKVIPEIGFRASKGKNVIYVDGADRIKEEFSSALEGIVDQETKIILSDNPLRREPSALKYYFEGDRAEKHTFSCLDHENVIAGLKDRTRPIQQNHLSVEWVKDKIAIWASVSAKGTIKFDGKYIIPKKGSEFVPRVLGEWV